MTRRSTEHREYGGVCTPMRNKITGGEFTHAQINARHVESKQGGLFWKQPKQTETETNRRTSIAIGQDRNRQPEVSHGGSSLVSIGRREKQKLMSAANKSGHSVNQITKHIDPLGAEFFKITFNNPAQHDAPAFKNATWESANTVIIRK